ncbi:MAG TPA: hypothetical protein VJO33_04560 [Gemmatimonadaceae bacterium]|nr:hypothetical protein [Gemmatimonadaceae bacterium]
MTSGTFSRGGWRRIASRLAILVVIAGTLALRVQNDSIGARLLASLRIARPAAVTAAVTTVAGSNSRQLQNVVAGIVSESTTIARDEPDSVIASGDAASRAAGFRFRPLHGRSDAARLSVTGAHRVEASVRREQLGTLLAEAGFPRTTLPASIDNAPISLVTPRGVRAEFGHCPAPVANTIQAQIQGPPPSSTDNGNCVVLTETPLAAVSVPAALDTSAVMTIALELSGMSPNQARDFRRLFGWSSAATIAPPRFMRSYEITSVGGAPAILMITGGRRGPTYVLAWVRDGIVFTLTGYGSSADAASLAASVS